MQAHSQEAHSVGAAEAMRMSLKCSSLICPWLAVASLPDDRTAMPVSGPSCVLNSRSGPAGCAQRRSNRRTKPSEQPAKTAECVAPDLKSAPARKVVM